MDALTAALIALLSIAAGTAARIADRQVGRLEVRPGERSRPADGAAARSE
jgi:hypothetical protein